MSHCTLFVQECPTCSRTLEIRIDHLGKGVYCEHCGAGFVANDAQNPSAEKLDAETLLSRAEKLLSDTQSMSR